MYLARSDRGRTVALKAVHAQVAHDPPFRARFRHEVEAATAVGGEYTAAVVDADPLGERPWPATQYVPGPSLVRAVRDHGPLPEAGVGLLGGAALLARGGDRVHVQRSGVLCALPVE